DRATPCGRPRCQQAHRRARSDLSVGRVPTDVGRTRQTLRLELAEGCAPVFTARHVAVAGHGAGSRPDTPASIVARAPVGAIATLLRASPGHAEANAGETGRKRMDQTCNVRATQSTAAAAEGQRKGAGGGARGGR